jgi:hypothetical protein
MEGYLEAIQTSVFFFPLIALLFTTPYMISQYHKYGAIHTFRTLLIYSFILYLLTAYFLVILPLPSIDEVAQLTTPRTQLIPFSFVADFITHTSFRILEPSTYLQAFKEPYFYQVIYNLLLTVPFGIYLRYYFKCSFKKTVLYTFLLTLFFEVTQLTGLYGIYPRNYRLFDVDDLMINTLGGVVGYFLAGMLQKVIPTRETIDMESYQLGKHVSPLRRIFTFGCDNVLYIIFVIGYTICGNPKHSFLIMFIVYYFILPLCLNGQTIGERFFHLQIVTTDTLEVSKKAWILRRILFYLSYFALPFILAVLYVQVIHFFQLDNLLALALGSCFVFGLIGFYTYSFIRFFFFNKPLLYETISHTKYQSTIQVEE